MKCERCGVVTIGPYDLHDYCELCGKNLCTGCMVAGVCADERAKDGQGEAVKYEYTLRTLGASSAKFGPCELCNEHVSEMHIQTEFEHCTRTGRTRRRNEGHR